jgi:hypothetical protein
MTKRVGPGTLGTGNELWTLDHIICLSQKGGEERKLLCTYITPKPNSWMQRWIT